MRRVAIEPRRNWQKEVEKWGLLFHTEESGVYWDESAYYEFTEEEVDAIETATGELHRMCIEAAKFVIRENRWDDLKIPVKARAAIVKSLERLEPTLYGRFDLCFDGDGPPKMLEYNADTPTSLLEAAVIQWKWLEARFPEEDQFNSLWEGLVDAWKAMLKRRQIRGTIVHFAHGDTLEDGMTITMLRDTAQEAGLTTEGLLMEEIGWNAGDRCFLDLEDRRMWTIFKLYPWEWLMADEFADVLLQSIEETQWIEPIWKMLLSNKAILAILWELFPDSPYLLPAYLDGPREMTSFVRKPILSREGANVEIHAEGVTVDRDGPYGAEGYVYQGLATIPSFDGKHPIVGSWVIAGDPRGIGIRESASMITDNTSQFVPHKFR
ncbi:glutathionylspermidine synthase family protein [bacterium]|nr:MAG: glutathionylspermidine synthase family protein [bacterium]